MSWFWSNQASPASASCLSLEPSQRTRSVAEMCCTMLLIVYLGVFADVYALDVNVYLYHSQARRFFDVKAHRVYHAGGHGANARPILNNDVQVNKYLFAVDSHFNAPVGVACQRPGDA